MAAWLYLTTTLNNAHYLSQPQGPRGGLWLQELQTIAIGQPRVVEWKGDRVQTSIFKTPVPGPVKAVRHNLEGDRQSDLEVHGGEYKAVYVYAAELEATIPRLPCYKLGIRFGNPTMVKKVTQARRWGIHFRVASEGEIAVGDRVELASRHPARVSAYDVARVYAFDRADAETMRRLVAHERLDPAWRAHFEDMLATLDGGMAG